MVYKTSLTTLYRLVYCFNFIRVKNKKMSFVKYIDVVETLDSTEELIQFVVLS